MRCPRRGRETRSGCWSPNYRSACPSRPRRLRSTRCSIIGSLLQWRSTACSRGRTRLKERPGAKLERLAMEAGAREGVPFDHFRRALEELFDPARRGTSRPSDADVKEYEQLIQKWRFCLLGVGTGAAQFHFSNFSTDLRSHLFQPISSNKTVDGGTCSILNVRAGPPKPQPSSEPRDRLIPFRPIASTQTSDELVL
jgi:hypothetical protein